MRQELERVVGDKGTIAIVSQAIADNFRESGPGWQPLKPQTIRQSVSKATRKRLVPGKYNTAVDKDGVEGQARQILRRTGLLMMAVTTPGAKGNVLRQEGSKLIWGTDLVYAGIHNTGGTINHPGTKNGFGKGITIPPHNIKIPQREFLVIRDKWRVQLAEFAAMRAAQVIKRVMGVK